MLRFAPNPTSVMHIGSLRVAILNYIVAKQRNEDFIVRVENMDKDNNIDGQDQEILDILALFSIEYSQVIYQSQNVRFHSTMALQLVHEREAFSCFCSDDWLSKKHKEAEQNKQEYSYDDACRNLPAELIIDNTNPFRIRVTRPATNLLIADKIQGDREFTPDEVDSFTILKQDKTPTSNFASGVDDMLSDISLIICDEKHIASTPKQDHVRAALKYDKKIEYAHIPSLKGDDVSVKELLEQGFLPEAILNYLISTLNGALKEVFTLQEAIALFDLSKVSNSPTVFDIEELKEINKKHLRALEPKELSRYVGFADAELGELARIYLEEVATTKELKSKIAPIFSKREIPDELTAQTAIMRETIMKAPYFEDYDSLKSHIIEKSGLKAQEYEKTLRVLLTNTTSGPDLSEIYKYLKNYIGEIIK